MGIRLAFFNIKKISKLENFRASSHVKLLKIKQMNDYK